MANKSKLTYTRTHHLTMSGGKNYSLIIPIEFIRHLEWKERQKLNITLEGDKLVIKDWSR